MPRSRSRSIESSTCASISRSDRPPHSWMMRSASVDLPWSMCAMMEKLRMRSIWGGQTSGGGERNKKGTPGALSNSSKQPVILTDDDGGGLSTNRQLVTTASCRRVVTGALFEFRAWIRSSASTSAPCDRSLRTPWCVGAAEALRCGSTPGIRLFASTTPVFRIANASVLANSGVSPARAHRSPRRRAWYSTQ